MKCHEFQELIDAYFEGTIEESRREQFEEHFFGCRACFLGLKINESLRNKEVRIPLSEKASFLPFRVLRPLLVMSSLFALILLSVLLVQRGRRAERLGDLARFAAPPYHQGEWRGESQGAPGLEELFAQAMRHYQQGDFRRALDLLASPLLNAAPSPKISFFRAICYLKTDQASKAGAEFDAIIRAMEPAYFDEALYYKGIVLLRLGQKDEARRQFAKLGAMLSPMTGKARAMVQKIDRI